MIAGRARFRSAKKLSNVVGYRIPEFAFHGAFLEAVTVGMASDYLDQGIRDQILNFFKDFLNCKCKQSPLCGCPERKFALLIIELRESGFDHRQIADFLLDEYGIEIFPADILSFLEESVHVLEAVRDVAELEGNRKVAEKAGKAIKNIEK